MRNLSHVICAIINQIPEDFEHRESLVRRLSYVKDSFAYTAPEALYLRWDQCSEILGEYIPKPTTDWQMTVANIFSADVNYEDYL